MIGLSTGCFYKIFEDELSNSTLEMLLDAEIKTVELNVIKKNKVNKLQDLSIELLNNFDFVSLHAPSDIQYTNNSVIEELLINLENFNNKVKLQNIVIHPDIVMDFSIFKKFPKLPFSIENMDNEKETYNSILDFNNELVKNFNFTLDLQHIYTNDRSLETTAKYIKRFKGKIKQIHISGYDKVKKHVPVYISKDEHIVKIYWKYQLNSYPTIIESVFDDKYQFRSELEYINQFKKH